MADFPLSCTLEDARNSLELARTMLKRARVMWENASKVLLDTKALRDRLYTQIEELSSRGAFRRPFTSTLLAGILDVVIEGTRADMGNIQLFDPKTGSLRIHVHRGFREPFLQFFNRVPCGHCACGTALRTARRVIVPDVADSPVFSDSDCLEALLDANVRAVQSTPIVGKSGHIWGVLSTHYRNVNRPSPSDLQLIDYYAGWAAALLEADYRAARRNGHSAAHNDNGHGIPGDALPTPV